MMEEKNPPRGKPGGLPPSAGGAPQPELPNDFFQALLNLPACKTQGYCDNCGRCER